MIICQFKPNEQRNKDRNQTILYQYMLRIKQWQKIRKKNQIYPDTYIN